MSSKKRSFSEQEFTLCSALVEATQQGESEAAELKEKQHILNSLQIHNRRCEANVKRLCCQLDKAQSSHGELSSDIFHMEKEVEHLKKQLGTSYNVE
ncbi:hypothetical protein PHYPO_G00101010 [Pangasianodon hypophthalmus]|uniref:Uncharacterized protein n=1 Tax=Pangasianodon hypophthalmus TaxID=310915 RepID=A0A5N5PY28_PANHP|nr:hypothetical protein PHYPO_G00101010 [Pangasianodon hypophthalmus]